MCKCCLRFEHASLKGHRDAGKVAVMHSNMHSTAFRHTGLGRPSIFGRSKSIPHTMSALCCKSLQSQ